MPISVAGNRLGVPSDSARGPNSVLGDWTARTARPVQRASKVQRGFTLIELLVVVFIIALGSAGVVLALRDSSQNQLEREGHRLAALLDSARAQSRASGTPVRWRATAQGFRFEGLPAQQLPGVWLDAQTRVHGGDTLLLGPEPIIAPQEIALSSALAPGRILRISTDGLRPFVPAWHQ